MKENDSNADLDLNLDDEFDLENSDADLAFDEPEASGANNDDSVELDELFGDSDDDFNFSKKEEINLAMDDEDLTQDELPGTAVTIEHDMAEPLDTIEPAAIDVENQLDEQPIDAAEVVDETNDFVDEVVESAAATVDHRSKKTASGGGFLSKIFGIFSRSKGSDYGADYEEFDEENTTHFSRSTPFSSKNDTQDPEVVEAEVESEQATDIDLELNDDMAPGLDEELIDDSQQQAEFVVETSTEEPMQQVDDSAEAVTDNDAVSAEETEDGSVEELDPSSPEVFKTVEVSMEDLNADFLSETSPSNVVEGESDTFERVAEHSDEDSPVLPSATESAEEMLDADIVVEAAEVVVDGADQPIDAESITPDAPPAAAGGFLSKIMGIFRRKPKEQLFENEPAEDDMAEQVVDDATVEPAGEIEMEIEEEFDHSAFAVNDSPAEATVAPDSTAVEPGEFDFNDDDDVIGFSSKDTVPEPDEITDFAEPAAETVREDLEFDDELDFSDEFDLDQEAEPAAELEDENDTAPAPGSALAEATAEEPTAHVESDQVEELPSQEQAIDAASLQITELQAELQSTLAALKESQDAMAANRGELNELTTQCQTLQDELNHTRSEQQSLEDELQQAKADLAQQTKTPEPSESATSDSEIFELKQQLDKEIQLRKDSEQFLAEAEEQRNEVARVLRQTRSELAAAQEAAQQQDAAVDAGQLEAHVQQIESLTSERDQLQRSLQSQSDAESQLRTQLEGFEQQNSQLQTQLEESQSKLVDVESSSAELRDQAEQAQNRIAELESQNSDLGEKLAAGDTELRIKSQELEAIRGELAEARQNSKESETEELKNELHSYKTGLADLESKLTANLSMMQQKDSQLASLQAELDNIKATTASSESHDAELTHLKRQLESAESEKQRIEQNVASLESELQTAKGQSEQLKVDLAKVETINQQLNEAVKEKSSAVNQLAELRRECDNAKLEVESARQKLELETASFQSRLETEQKLTISASEESARLKTEIDQLKGQLAENQKLLDSERSANANLSKEVESQRGSLQEFAAKLEASDAISSVNQQLQDAVKRQEQRISEMEISNRGALDRIESLIAAQATASKSGKSGNKSAAKAKSSKKSGGDDLTKINGIGPVMQKRLSKLGITSFKQIAAWSASDIKEWEAKLERNTIGKDDWVKQAKKLV